MSSLKTTTATTTTTTITKTLFGRFAIFSEAALTELVMPRLNWGQGAQCNKPFYGRNLRMFVIR